MFAELTLQVGGTTHHAVTRQVSPLVHIMCVYGNSNEH